MKPAAWVIFGALFFSGCQSKNSNLPATVPAEGIVTLDGNPVPNAAVTFLAESGNYHATAVTDAEGKFALKAFEEKKGAVPGSYKVEVNQTVVTGGENQVTPGGEGGPVTVKFGLPEKYSSITTSGLTNTIPESGNTGIKIELTSK